MFFLINFSYNRWVGIHTRLLPSVIPAQAGMTAEVSAKFAPPVFRRPFASSVYIVAWALPTIIAAKRGRLKFWV